MTRREADRRPEARSGPASGRLGKAWTNGSGCREGRHGLGSSSFPCELPSAVIGVTFLAMMQLAFSTNAYTRFSLIESLRRIREAGFGAVEILADQPHAYPEQMTPGLAMEVADELSRLGLSVSNVNANCTFGYWRDPPPEAFFWTKPD